jgi:hypothetical protein
MMALENLGAHARIIELLERRAEALVRSQLTGLIAARGTRPAADRYADLRSLCQTPDARELILQLCTDISAWEQWSGTRIRKRRARSETKFATAVERFVADLLLSRADTKATGRAYRTLDKNKFTGDVKYDVFVNVLDGLKAIGLAGHTPGKRRYRATGFGFNASLPAPAARYWATTKLLKTAKLYGIQDHNISQHFGSEPPTAEQGKPVPSVRGEDL